jgi:crotonobetainyl-CoA:carnitine CoA-transferase CaiB-like acyl-CoA transferase
MRPPYRLAKTPAEVRTMPPRFGQHTAEVLAELGYTETEIAAMLAAGAAVVDKATTKG